MTIFPGTTPAHWVGMKTPFVTRDAILCEIAVLLATLKVQYPDGLSTVQAMLNRIQVKKAKPTLTLVPKEPGVG